MAREDHIYVNLDKNLIKIVDDIVNRVYWNGSRKYVDRKDFVTKSVQSNIETELKNLEVSA